MKGYKSIRVHKDGVIKSFLKGFYRYVKSDESIAWQLDEYKDIINDMLKDKKDGRDKSNHVEYLLETLYSLFNWEINKSIDDVEQENTNWADIASSHLTLFVSLRYYIAKNKLCTCCGGPRN